MEKKSNEVLALELTKALPTEAVKPHPTKTYLSSIKAIYVTERLNEVFGTGAWQIRTQEIERGDKGMVVVKAILTVPMYDIYYESYGGNDNGGEASKNFDLGDAYKGATTDAITKIGSYLGIGIDVFKGKVTPSKSNEHKDPNAPELPWLNEKDPLFPQMLEAVRHGKRTVVQLREKYKISKEVQAKLEA